MMFNLFVINACAISKSHPTPPPPFTKMPVHASILQRLACKLISDLFIFLINGIIMIYTIQCD